jgi:hypothetical protein
LVVLGIAAPVLAGIIVVMLSSGPPLDRADGSPPMLALSAAPAISAAGAEVPSKDRTVLARMDGSRNDEGLSPTTSAIPQNSEAPAPSSSPVVAVGIKKDMAPPARAPLMPRRESTSVEQKIPPQRPAAASPAPAPVAPVASPASTPTDSKADAGAGSQIAAIAPRKDAPVALGGQAAPHHDGSLQPLMPATSPPQVDAVSSAPAPGVSPAPAAAPDAEALAEADRRIAAVESERDALAAEVARLERQDKSSASQPANPPLPVSDSTTAVSLAPPVTESSVDFSAASATLPQDMPARVLIRYLKNNADARAQAEKLASALAARDVEVADVRDSRTAMRTELSFSYAPDETIAREVGRIVGVAPVRRLRPKDGLMLRPGTVELNLSGDSHLAEIKPTSSRERNHE